MPRKEYVRPAPRLLALDAAARVWCVQVQPTGSRQVMTKSSHPRIRVLNGREIALGPGKVELIEGIDELGSISAAGRRMGMSYRRAWLLVSTLNGCFREPLVEAAKGGIRGGGARVTEFGHTALKRYRRLEGLAAREFDDLLAPPRTPRPR